MEGDGGILVLFCYLEKISYESMNMFGIFVIFL